MLEEVLKDSWVCQEWIERGREQGLEEVRQSQRLTVEQIVEQRFPALEALASEQVAQMSDIKALTALIVDIACARDADAVRKLLLDAGKDS